MNLKEESNIVQYLVTTQGWRLIEQYIKEEFDKEYAKLRRCGKDSAFYRLRGKLDGLEFVLNLPERIIKRGELETQPT